MDRDAFETSVSERRRQIKARTCKQSLVAPLQSSPTSPEPVSKSYQRGGWLAGCGGQAVSAIVQNGEGTYQRRGCKHVSELSSLCSGCLVYPQSPDTLRQTIGMKT